VDPVDATGVAEIALLAAVSELEDASELVSRVYPYGAGMGGQRVTLGQATSAAPDGYVFDKVEGYVERTAAVAALGVVETARSWSDIVEQTDDTTAAAQSAANTLLLQAVNWLAQHSATDLSATGDAPRFYDLALVKCAGVLAPGHQLRVVHHRWVDGYHAVNIDRDLWITEATWRVGDNGVETVGLQVASVARPPVSDALAVATGIRRLVGTLAHNSAAGY
jgi:hypothetical protein